MPPDLPEPGSPAPTELARRRPPSSGLPPPSASFLLQYVDLAIAGTLEFARYHGVYLSPWWDVPPGPDPERVRAWKRAVLRREPGRGAEHWGHLFLVCQLDDGPTQLRLEPTRLPRGPPPAPLEIPLRLGDPHLRLVLRPSHAERREELARFGEDVAERFRRQMD